MTTDMKTNITTDMTAEITTNSPGECKVERVKKHH